MTTSTEADLAADFTASLFSFNGAIEDWRRTHAEVLNGMVGKMLLSLFKDHVEKFDKCEALRLWDEWTRALAFLVWLQNGAHEDQPKQVRDDDYMHAKRYLAYLLAEDIARQMTDGSLCPAETLTCARTKYLQSLSVDEFVQFRAYFYYLERRRKGGEDSPEQRERDYFAALSAIRRSLDVLLSETCEATRITKCRSKLGILRLESDLLPHGQQVARMSFDTNNIKLAKKRALSRLHLEPYVHHLVDCFVDSFYDELGLPTDAGGSQVATKASEILFKHSAVPNMFEFFAMCLLIRCGASISPSVMQGVPRHPTMDPGLGLGS